WDIRTEGERVCGCTFAVPAGLFSRRLTSTPKILPARYVAVLPSGRG
ncbi:hypothetical protein LEMLEM_LOCUS1144, partial [Lemmus lemmus]